MALIINEFYFLSLKNADSTRLLTVTPRLSATARPRSSAFGLMVTEIFRFVSAFRFAPAPGREPPRFGLSGVIGLQVAQRSAG